MSTSIKVYGLDGKSTRSINLNDQLLVQEPNKQAIFDCVICENAAQRQGTHSTLTKGEVRGGGKKPWRQKHTGRARTGSIRNPQWRGGGVVFGPKPNRNYTKKVNAKVRILAFKSVLTLKALNADLLALDAKTGLKKPSTKTMAGFIEKMGLADKKVLIISNNVSNNVEISTNNLPKVCTKLWDKVSVRDVLHANVVLAYEDTFEKYAQQFQTKLAK